MRTNRRFTAYLATLLLLMLPLIGRGHMSPVNFVGSGTPAVGGTGADDTQVAALIKFIGHTGVLRDSGLVEIAADGNIVLTSGAQGAEAADTTLECPVSGALGGIVDVSDAACDTFAEVADVINASADWVIVLVNARRADTSDDVGLDIGPLDATKPEGFQMQFDTTVSLNTSVSLFTGDMETNMARWLTPQNTLMRNPFAGTWTALYNAHGYSTWNTTSNTQIVSIVSDNLRGTETVRVLYSVAGGATGTDKDYSPGVLFRGDVNAKVQIRNICTATMSAQNLYAYGETYFN